MSRKAKIRPLSESDLDAIVEIDRKILGKRRWEFWERKVKFADIYPRPSLVAEMDGKVVGFIMGYVSGWEFGVPDTVGWIDTIGVDPEYQRKGIAKALFTELVRSLKTTGREEKPEAPGGGAILGVDTLYTVVNWTDLDLLGFFQKMGFKRGDMIHLELRP